jgi:hypothetical protein
MVMATSINWGTKVISVLQADLTYLGGTAYSMDTEAFRLELRDLEDGWDGILFPITHRHATEVLLGGVTYARFMEIVNGYTITFEETGSPYSVSLLGTNNNILEVTNLGTVQILSNNSAGLVSNATPAEIATAVWEKEINGTLSGSFGEAAKTVSFQEHIHVDVNNGAAGTAYPLGTHLHPVDSIADAVAIGLATGISRILLSEDVVVQATDTLDGFHLQGSHATKSQVTVLPGASTDLTQFTNCYLTGTLDGWVVVRDSMIEDLIGVQGIFHNTMINPGEIVLGGVRATHFLSCYSGVPGLSTPTIDFNGSGPTAALRGYNGGIKLENKTGLESVSIDMASGQIIIDDTVTTGILVMRGPGEWSNKAAYAGGANVVDQLIEGTQLHEVHEAHFHRRTWDSVGNTITIFEDDGLTPKHIFDTNADLSDINPQ